MYPLQDQKDRRLKRQVQKIILLVICIKGALLYPHNHYSRINIKKTGINPPLT